MPARRVRRWCTPRRERCRARLDERSAGPDWLSAECHLGTYAANDTREGGINGFVWRLLKDKARGSLRRVGRCCLTVEPGLVGGDGGGGCGGEFCYACDHVAYGAEGAEGFVGDFDVESFLDLEGDVDLVEGVDVELVEGAGKGDGVRRNVLRVGDDGNAAGGDVVHGVSTSFGLTQLTGRHMPV